MLHWVTLLAKSAHGSLVLLFENFYLVIMSRFNFCLCHSPIWHAVLVSSESCGCFIMYLCLRWRCPPYLVIMNASLDFSANICIRFSNALSPPLDHIRVMVIVWRLRGNIIGTALCWIVWHNVYSQQHTYASSSYRWNRLGFVTLGPLRCA